MQNRRSCLKQNSRRNTYPLSYDLTWYLPQTAASAGRVLKKEFVDCQPTSIPGKDLCWHCQWRIPRTADQLFQSITENNSKTKYSPKIIQTFIMSEYDNILLVSLLFQVQQVQISHIFSASMGKAKMFPYMVMIHIHHTLFDFYKYFTLRSSVKYCNERFCMSVCHVQTSNFLWTWLACILHSMVLFCYVFPFCGWHRICST